jgi:hypothetical protein
MAVRTNFELFDVIDPTKDFSISAIDLNNNTQVIISTDNAIQYMLHKYGTRFYPVLRGGVAPTLSDGKGDFYSDFRLWVLNRQHNIDRMYQALFDYDYSPIENVDRYENETTNTDNTTTYGKSTTEGGTDRTTYGKTLSKTGSDTDTKTGTETLGMSGGETNEIQKAGFNSPNSYTPDTKSIDSFQSREDRTTFNTTEGHSHNTTDTEGGSDSVSYGKTLTDGGHDDSETDQIRSLRVHGNIGVTTNTELIESELKLRIRSLAEMLLDNFIADYTFYA